MLKKTEIEILKQFTIDLDSKKTIKELSDATKKHYPLVHRTVKALIKNDYLLRDKHNLIFLNLKNYSELAYVEALKAKDFLKKNKNFAKILDKIEIDFFILIISGKNVIVIVEDKDNVAIPEGIKVFSKKEALEMLSKTREDNILNRSLRNHIILFGAENYYRVLNNAR